MNVGNELRKFFRPFLQNHKATVVPGQPRDILDINVEKINASYDDTSSSFSDGKARGATVTEFPEFMKFIFIMQFATSKTPSATPPATAAGMETTSSQLEWIIYYMAKYPSIQEKLIGEIDSLLPTACMPSFSDRTKLHYTEAVVNEALRISTIVPFGLFHSALEDTEIAGYNIPKDTLVIGNLYAVNNDPNVWESPHEFRPERFITEDGRFHAGENPVYAFGVGNRSCIGEGLARNQLFLFTTRIFQNFRVKAVGELCSKHEFSLAVAPEQFQVVFERRTDHCLDLK